VDVDPATTDAERAAWDVPPLQRLHEIAAEATANTTCRRLRWKTSPSG
jgi:hypothetical protein